MMYRDLEAAREIQSRLFPGPLPYIHGLDYYGECRPAQHIGGDFFDFLPLPEQRLSIAVGDVSGHGISSAILMSGMPAFLRGMTARGFGEISESVRELNHSVYRVSPENFYATLFYAQIEPLRRELQYVSAGHEAALLVRKRSGQILRLESTGTVLGLTDRSSYGKRSVPLEAGDVLVAFTDGVTDAADSYGHEWGEDGLRQLLRERAGLRAPELVSAILEAAARFDGRSSAEDDRTVAAVRFVGMAEHLLVEEDELELELTAA